MIRLTPDIVIPMFWILDHSLNYGPMDEATGFKSIQILELNFITPSDIPRKAIDLEDCSPAEPRVPRKNGGQNIYGAS